VQSIPGAGLSIPLWLLGSSTFSAEEAGTLGLPFAFATHIASAPVSTAIETYRSNFRPSATLDRPYAMVGVLVIAAETDKEARYLFTSLQQCFIGMKRRKSGPLPPPVDDISTLATPEVLAAADNVLSYKIVGSRETVHQAIDRLLADTTADELIVLTMMHDWEALIRSFAIVAEHEAFEPVP
jgi:luciferase family oxidoreductase group 1